MSSLNYEELIKIAKSHAEEYLYRLDAYMMREDYINDIKNVSDLCCLHFKKVQCFSESINIENHFYIALEYRCIFKKSRNFFKDEIFKESVYDVVYDMHISQDGEVYSLGQIQTPKRYQSKIHEWIRKVLNRPRGLLL